eukprot:TRINITY_DN4711_c0_g5_i1.p1 TRINITY_DN4711_c0_g5~~TRINITY_DN4711_c0_g5_i1.p1  ORF type:complete len:248 (-),score=28.58 TRINITY_DN4711_c0_g5_i1:66-809(-)
MSEEMDGPPPAVSVTAWPRTMSDDDLAKVAGLNEDEEKEAAPVYAGNLRTNAVDVRAPPGAEAPYWQPAKVPPPPLSTAPPAMVSNEPPQVLQLSAILEGNQRSSADVAGGLPDSLPSVGSAQHGTGLCKPCAFLYTKGCRNDKECTFCHLCEGGEKKRRQKERKELVRQQREQGHTWQDQRPDYRYGNSEERNKIGRRPHDQPRTWQSYGYGAAEDWKDFSGRMGEQSLVWPGQRADFRYAPLAPL